MAPTAVTAIALILAATPLVPASTGLRPRAPAAAQTQVPNATTIKTAKGDLLVPGRAYLDGRDLEAHPPFTAMTIRIWQSPELRHAICSAEHGAAADLVEVQRGVEEGRYYFRLKTGRCEGWVPDTALSPAKTAPVGQQRR